MDIGSKILVLGIGNVLRKDEGVGVHVIEELRKLELPKGVEILDGWVAGIDLLEPIKRADYLIVVDAIEANAKAGSIFRFNAGEVDIMLSGQKASLHQVDLPEALKIANFLGFCPKTAVIGIQPKDTGWGLELTSEIASCIPRITDFVVKEISALAVATGSERSDLL